MWDFNIVLDSKYAKTHLGNEQYLVFNEIKGRGRILIFSTVEDTKALLQEDMIFAGSFYN